MGGRPPTVGHRGGRTTPGDHPRGVAGGGATTPGAFGGGRDHPRSTPGVVAAPPGGVATATPSAHRGWSWATPMAYRG
jgi:hypothetical protein